ncbi:MAG: hypothetical protein LC795_16360 [Acidobacteria bacterium]|nr:hypothetical protein [Acidobacteriota bacterium]
MNGHHGRATYGLRRAVRLRFDPRLVVFIGAARVACAGSTLTASARAGAASAADVCESSTVGLGEAMTCCCCCGGVAVSSGLFMPFAGAAAGSVSPPEATQAP